MSFTRSAAADDAADAAAAAAADDDSIIDLTGRPAVSIPAPAAPLVTPPLMPYFTSYHHYSRPAQLGDLYEQPLGLQRNEVT
ncbi:hypothetical protein GCM10022408_08810 [Hymenobacter fastidiosus]|uniref:Uncharacterized protein n=1 Tax=Hymenobacter fastidiosus TaxID=486264 RepID=A0ABP7RNB7_9BACT